jgi:hypothetical protein
MSQKKYKVLAHCLKAQLNSSRITSNDVRDAKKLLGLHAKLHNYLNGGLFPDEYHKINDCQYCISNILASFGIYDFVFDEYSCHHVRFRSLPKEDAWRYRNNNSHCVLPFSSEL